MCRLLPPPTTLLGPATLTCVPPSACPACAAATGYSITRSLREAPAVARAVRVALDEQPSSAAAVRFVWEALWTQERRRQVRGPGWDGQGIRRMFSALHHCMPLACTACLCIRWPAVHGGQMASCPPAMWHFAGCPSQTHLFVLSFGLSPAAAGLVPGVWHGAVVPAGHACHRRLLHHLLPPPRLLLARIPGQQAQLGCVVVSRFKASCG